MVFHWSLSDSKSPQVSRTLLSILSYLNDIVVWMVPTLFFFFLSFFDFQLYVRFLTILHRVFTKDVGGRKVVIIYFTNLCSYSLLRDIFLIYIDNTLLRRRAFSQSAIFFCISCRLQLSGILLMCLPTPFLDHTQCSHYYRHGSSFQVPNYSISISRCLYSLILLYFFFLYSYFITFFSLGIDISIKRNIFLLLFLTNIFDLLLFILLSVWVAKFQRIVSPFASFIVSDWC